MNTVTADVEIITSKAFNNDEAHVEYQSYSLLEPLVYASQCEVHTHSLHDAQPELTWCFDTMVLCYYQNGIVLSAPILHTLSHRTTPPSICLSIYMNFTTHPSCWSSIRSSCHPSVSPLLRPPLHSSSLFCQPLNNLFLSNVLRCLETPHA